MNFEDARRVVNGDVAQNGALIGGYAQSYAATLNEDDAWGGAMERPAPMA